MALKEKIYWPGYLVVFSFMILTWHVDSLLGCVSMWDPKLLQSWLVWGVVKAEIVLGMWRCHCWAYVLEDSRRKLVQGHFQDTHENAGGRDMPPRYV